MGARHKPDCAQLRSRLNQQFLRPFTGNIRTFKFSSHMPFRKKEPKMTANLYQLLSELNAQAASVRSDYNDLFASDIPTIPIPILGDLSTARVVNLLGSNPSDGEFKDRGWPQSMGTPQLNERLTRYFCNPKVEPHKWFTIWEIALNQIGASYKNGTAAHIDLCPWPTKSAGSFNKEIASRKKFIQLAAQKLAIFLALSASSAARAAGDDGRNGDQRT